MCKQIIRYDDIARRFSFQESIMTASESLPLPRPSSIPENHTPVHKLSNTDLDRLTRLVSKTLHVPIVFILLFDQDKHGIISSYGIAPMAFAGILLPPSTITGYATHNADGGLQMQPPALAAIAQRLGAQSYLASQLVSTRGQELGILCVLDTETRTWDDDENVILQDFAQLAVTELELMFKVDELEHVKSELAEKHEVLRTLIDTSPDYIFVKDAEGRFVISNRAHSQAAGIDDPAFLTGKTASETFPAELAAQYNDDDSRVIRSGEPLINIERQTLDADGALRWVLTSKIPLRGNEGGIRGLIGISRDITDRKLAEAALRDREAFIHQVIATSPAMIYIYDLTENRNVYSNVEIFEVLGYTPDEIRGFGSNLFTTLMHPEDLANFGVHMARVMQLKDGEVADLEYRMCHRNGEYRWLYGREVIFKRVLEGTPSQTIGTVLDITRVKNAEAALRESEARVRALVNTAPVIFAQLDAQGVITAAEGEGIWRLGQAPEKLLGQNLLDLASAMGGPEHKHTVRLRNALAGEPCDFIFDNDTAVFQMRFTPTFHLQTLEVTGVIIIGVDVTEQVRARDELVEINGRLSRLRKIDTALTERLDITHVVNTTLSSLIEESAAEAGCIALLEDGKLNAQTSVCADLLIEADAEIQQALKGGRPIVRCGDGTALPTYLPPDTPLRIVLPLVYGDVTNGIVVLKCANAKRYDEDLFEFLKSIALRAGAALENARLYVHLNEVYERVRSLEQLKTDMIRIAAHDLRNPLTAIKGYLTLLSNDLGKEKTSRQENYFAMLEQSATAMHRIISEILSLQRIEAIHDHPDETPVDLVAIVKELYARHLSLAQQKHMHLALKIMETPIMMSGDEAQLREAIDNLIQNAIKYTPDGGCIAIRLYKHTTDLHFEVEDSGYGIPRDQQANLFQPFYRSRTSVTQHIEGTGLGLHLVKKIIERHRGHVIFNSVEGKGSVFGFSIPSVEATTATSAD
jgi:PAS domain S-box-containing protein